MLKQENFGGCSSLDCEESTHDHGSDDDVKRDGEDQAVDHSRLDSLSHKDADIDRDKVVDIDDRAGVVVDIGHGRVAVDIGHEGEIGVQVDTKMMMTKTKGNDVADSNMMSQQGYFQPYEMMKKNRNGDFV